MKDAIATRGGSTRREELRVANRATEAQREIEFDQASTGGLVRFLQRAPCPSLDWGLLPNYRDPLTILHLPTGRRMGIVPLFTAAPCPSLDRGLFPYYRGPCDLDRSKDRLGTVPLQAQCMGTCGEEKKENEKNGQVRNNIYTNTCTIYLP